VEVFPVSVRLQEVLVKQMAGAPLAQQ
jgi:hypothetical protein